MTPTQVGAGRALGDPKCRCGQDLAAYTYTEEAENAEAPDTITFTIWHIALDTATGDDVYADSRSDVGCWLVDGPPPEHDVLDVNRTVLATGACQIG